MVDAGRRLPPGIGRGRRPACREGMRWPVRLAGLLLLAATVGGCGDRPTGRLELQLRIAEADLGGLAELRLEPDWAGASRHPNRDAGWRRIALLERSLALSPAGSLSVSVASGDLPAGRYDRVLVSTPIVSGRTSSGAVVPVVSHIEPIARDFELPGGSSLRIAIDLVLRPAAAGGQGFEIFVKQAELLEPSQAEAGGEVGR